MAASSSYGEAPNGGESVTTETPPRWQHGEAMASLDPEKEEGRGEEGEGEQVETEGGLLDLQLPRRRAAWARGRWRHGASAMAATVSMKFLENPLATFK